MDENPVWDYQQLAAFVGALPGSAPPGGMHDQYSAQDGSIDPALEKRLAAKDAVYILDKYHVTPVDRRKLIIALFNVKTIGPIQC